MNDRSLLPASLSPTDEIPGGSKVNDRLDERIGVSNRTQLIKVVAARSTLTQMQTKEAIEVLTSCIEDALVLDDKVKIRDFGIFERRVRKPVTRLNPRSGVPTHVPEKVSVLFLPSRNLRDRVDLRRANALKRKVTPM